MELNARELIDYVSSREWKEWKSKKEFDEYLIEENRYDIIGYVTEKTLRKWGQTADWRGWRNEEDMYILQRGNKYYYLTFRKGHGFLLGRKNF